MWEFRSKELFDWKLVLNSVFHRYFILFPQYTLNVKKLPFTMKNYKFSKKNKISTVTKYYWNNMFTK